jgi:hypothetical protein
MGCLHAAVYYSIIRVKEEADSLLLVRLLGVLSRLLMVSKILFSWVIWMPIVIGEVLMIIVEQCT